MTNKKKGLGNTLKKILDLGVLVAEDDSDLQSYYVGHDRYLKQALSLQDSRIFYIGPKGVGKSAILQMVRLTQSHDSQRIINISPDNLAFSALGNINVQNPIIGEPSKNEWLFRTLWDYVLLMELWEKENKHQTNLLAKFTDLFRSKDEQRIRRLYNMTIDDEGKCLNFTDRIIQLIDEIDLTVSNETGGVTGGVKINSNQVGSQFKFLSEINAAAKKLPDLLKNEYYVLIDDLDLYWRNEANQNTLIAALFTSLRHLSGSRLKFLVSIREDIYQCLPIQDKDKSRDRICKIEWDIETLKEIIEKRITAKSNCSTTEIWGNLFPNDFFESISKYTTNRPREIIRATSLCVQKAVSRDHKRVAEDDMHVAIREFSVERLEDLSSEVHYQYPEIRYVFEKFRQLAAEFSFDQLNDLAIELECERFDHPDLAMPWAWAGTYDGRTKEFAHILLEIGFLQIKTSRKAKPEDYNYNTIGDVCDTMWFAVHPMYRPGLGLTVYHSSPQVNQK